MKIIKETENKQLKRIEVSAVFTEQSNPGYSKVVKELSEHFKINEENIALKSLQGKFGSNNFSVEAFIYSSKKDKDAFEPRKKEAKKAEGVK